ncbi:putative RNA-directed DNA polymerase from transposon X-element [Araneus ventricosus]|uniref:Putative RNA-directed DNA polymerase from transposon X-element n=1 Tax=Araneus ventricosus TaxID=182803 RepID=A0A4Y2MME9_ARAVE|nr:putative RNA-directed DNA polymerase from transposon X-element [Araneus ventricosus]
MNSNTGIVVYTWNANGLYGKVNDLREFLSRKNPDIVLIQETHLSGLDRCYFPNYTFYSTLSRTHYKRRGTAVLIKSCITHHHVPNPNLYHVEATMVVATFHSLPPINFISVYNPPLNTSMFTNDLEKLISYNSSTFIAGDFNAKNRQWNCSTTCRLGKHLLNFVKITKQIHLTPESPTRISTTGASIIDFAITRNINYLSTVRTENEPSSYHLPVRFWLDTGTDPHYSQTFITNWKKYQQHIITNNTVDFVPLNCEDIEKEIGRFTNEHLEAVKASGTWVKNSSEEFSLEIKSQTKLRNNLQKIFQKSRDPRDKNLLNRAHSYLRKLHYEANQRRETNRITSLNPTDGSIWRQVKRLTEIINSILKFQYFPNYWKTAIVAPILKPGKNPREPSSYRPISLLSSLSKIAEAVILKRLTEATEDRIIPFQFGFRKNLSTVQQLLRITEVIREGMDEDWDTGAVFLDIAKAFDRVWTDGLVYKLIELRVPGSIIRLIATYLRGRHFAIRVGNSLSSERAIDSGVVQGSKVGPYLFNIYVNDIPSPRNCQTKICLFADDTAVMSTGASTHVMTSLNEYLD